MNEIVLSRSVFWFSVLACMTVCSCLQHLVQDNQLFFLRTDFLGVMHFFMCVIHMEMNTTIAYGSLSVCVIYLLFTIFMHMYIWRAAENAFKLRIVSFLAIIVTVIWAIVVNLVFENQLLKKVE